MHNVSLRFKKDLIYTSTGPILIALNPFKTIKGIYSDEQCAIYHESLALDTLPPHCFKTAEAALRIATGKAATDASIVICGESGAGKTETTKLMLSYLSRVCSASGDSMSARIMETNPVLEAFGNAKTTRNHNSSRFGKLIRVLLNNIPEASSFDRGAVTVAGATITNYLLEKSRACFQPQMERNFHIFYQMLSTTDEDILNQLKLMKPSKYAYLNQSSCYVAPGIDDSAEWVATQQGFAGLGVSQSELKPILQVLSGILQLGNVQFHASDSTDGTESSEPTERDSIETAAGLFEVSPEALIKALTTREIKTAGKTLTTSQRPEQAIAARDALSKALYSALFDQVVIRVNAALDSDSSSAGAASAAGASSKPDTTSVGILDVFGLENLQHNAFEQLFINYANEKLQQIFNFVVFTTEKREYEAEGVPFEQFKMPDNTACIELLESRGGILDLMNEECILGSRGSDLQLISKMHKQHSKHSHYATAGPSTSFRRTSQEFAIVHFAGPILYTCQDFVEKNKDTLHSVLPAAMASSRNSFISALLEAHPQEAGSTPGSPAFVGRSAPRSSHKTVASRFKTALGSLVSSLRSTESSFVRCIKTNSELKPGVIERLDVLNQLAYAGVIAALETRRSGFPSRLIFPMFAERYLLLLGSRQRRSYSPPSKLGQLGKEAMVKLCQLIMTSDCVIQAGIGIEDFSIGRTKVFLKCDVLGQLDSIASRKLNSAATLIGKHFRRYQHQSAFKFARTSIVKFQAARRGSLVRKEHAARCAALAKRQGVVKGLGAKRELEAKFVKMYESAKASKSIERPDVKKAVEMARQQLTDFSQSLDDASELLKAVSDEMTQSTFQEKIAILQSSAEHLPSQDTIDYNIEEVTKFLQQAEQVSAGASAAIASSRSLQSSLAQAVQGVQSAVNSVLPGAKAWLLVPPTNQGGDDDVLLQSTNAGVAGECLKKACALLNEATILQQSLGGVSELPSKREIERGHSLTKELQELYPDIEPAVEQEIARRQHAVRTYWYFESAYEDVSGILIEVKDFGENPGLEKYLRPVQDAAAAALASKKAAYTQEGSMGLGLTKHELFVQLRQIAQEQQPSSMGTEPTAWNQLASDSKHLATILKENKEELKRHLHEARQLMSAKAIAREALQECQRRLAAAASSTSTFGDAQHSAWVAFQKQQAHEWKTSVSKIQAYVKHQGLLHKDSIFVESTFNELQTPTMAQSIDMELYPAPLKELFANVRQPYELQDSLVAALSRLMESHAGLPSVRNVADAQILVKAARIKIVEFTEASKAFLVKEQTHLTTRENFVDSTLLPLQGLVQRFGSWTKEVAACLQNAALGTQHKASCETFLATANELVNATNSTMHIASVTSIIPVAVLEAKSKLLRQALALAAAETAPLRAAIDRDIMGRNRLMKKLIVIFASSRTLIEQIQRGSNHLPTGLLSCFNSIVDAADVARDAVSIDVVKTPKGVPGIADSTDSTDLVSTNHQLKATLRADWANVFEMIRICIEQLPQGDGIAGADEFFAGLQVRNWLSISTITGSESDSDTDDEGDSGSISSLEPDKDDAFPDDFEIETDFLINGKVSVGRGRRESSLHRLQKIPLQSAGLGECEVLVSGVQKGVDSLKQLVVKERKSAATKFSLVSEAANDVLLLQHRLDHVQQLIHEAAPLLESQDQRREVAKVMQHLKYETSDVASIADLSRRLWHALKATGWVQSSTLDECDDTLLQFMRIKASSTAEHILIDSNECLYCGESARLRQNKMFKLLRRLRNNSKQAMRQATQEAASGVTSMLRRDQVLEAFNRRIQAISATLRVVPTEVFAAIPESCISTTLNRCAGRIARLERIVTRLVADLEQRRQSEAKAAKMLAQKRSQALQELLQQTAVLETDVRSLQERFTRLISAREQEDLPVRGSSKLADIFHQVEVGLNSVTEHLCIAQTQPTETNNKRLQANLNHAVAAVEQAELLYSLLSSEAAGDGLSTNPLAQAIRSLQTMHNVAVFTVEKLGILLQEHHEAGLREFEGHHRGGRHSQTAADFENGVYLSALAADAVSSGRPLQHSEQELAQAGVTGGLLPHHIIEALSLSQHTIDALVDSSVVGHTRRFDEIEARGTASPSTSAAYISRKLIASAQRTAFALISAVCDLPQRWSRYLTRSLELARHAIEHLTATELDMLDKRLSSVASACTADQAKVVRHLVSAARSAQYKLLSRESHEALKLDQVFGTEYIAAFIHEIEALQGSPLETLLEQIERRVPHVLDKVQVMYSAFTRELHEVLPPALRDLMGLSNAIADAKAGALAALGISTGQQPPNPLSTVIRSIVDDCPDLDIPAGIIPSVRTPIAGGVYNSPAPKQAAPLSDVSHFGASGHLADQLASLRRMKQSPSTFSQENASNSRTILASSDKQLSPGRRSRPVQTQRVTSLSDARKRLGVLSAKLKTPLAWAPTSSADSPSKALVFSIRNEVSPSIARLRGSPVSLSLKHFMSRAVDDIQRKLMSSSHLKPEQQGADSDELHAPKPDVVETSLRSSPAGSSSFEKEPTSTAVHEWDTNELAEWLQQQTSAALFGTTSPQNLDSKPVAVPTTWATSSAPNQYSQLYEAASVRTAARTKRAGVRKSSPDSPAQPRAPSVATRSLGTRTPRSAESPPWRPAGSPRRPSPSKAAPATEVTPPQPRPTAKSRAAAAHQLFRMRRQAELKRLEGLIGTGQQRRSPFVRAQAPI